jgi:hypothetical protein
MSQKVEVGVEITPIWGISKKSYVKLPESAYGELLIYDDDMPIFYLYIFDEIYSEVLEQFKQSALTLSELAKKSFSKNGLPYSLNQNLFGLKLSPYPKKIILDKYPVDYLQNSL